MADQIIKEMAINKILDLSEDQVAKVLIFMAGLDAGMKLSASHAQPASKPAENTD